MTRALLAAALTAALAAGSAAFAQEVITTGPTGAAPPPEPTPAGTAKITDPDPEQSPQAIGAWARGVLSGKPSADDQHAAAARHGCTPPADRKPHGEVWAGVGSGGYREAGGVVTAPIGDCAEATIMIDKTRGPDFHHRR